MPPVPVHIDDPITPQKHANPAPAASVTQQQQTPSYAGAQPGAAAVPAPTGTPYTPNQYQPPPTGTATSAANSGPPPPQPGAAPVPPSYLQPQAPVTSLPPPPKAGEAAKLREQLQQASPAVTTIPAQMAMSPPEQNYAPTHATSIGTPTTAGVSGPTTLNFGAVTPIAGGIAPPSHPPGYQQNVMAQEMRPAARASLDAHERGDGLAGGGLGGYTGGGGLTGDSGSGSVWDTVKGYAAAAQQGLVETERKVWDRINKST